MTYVPPYKQITEWLGTVMEQRNHGAILPTTSEAQQRFGGGGVETVRRAYNTLIDAGLVTRKDSPRRYFVIDPSAAESGNHGITRLVTELKMMHTEPTSCHTGMGLIKYSHGYTVSYDRNHSYPRDSTRRCATTCELLGQSRNAQGLCTSSRGWKDNPELSLAFSWMSERRPIQ